MSKSLNARCIRRWEVEFKPFCDSKRNPYWRKRDLRGYIREAALTTAYSMVESMAERNAKVDFDGSYKAGLLSSQNGTGSVVKCISKKPATN